MLTPAGLSHTTYEQQPLEATAPYSYDHPAAPGATGLAVGIIPDPSVYFTAGALWSTVEDLVQWDAKSRDGAELQGQNAQRSIECSHNLGWRREPGYRHAPPGALTHWCQKILLPKSRAARIGTARDDLTKVIDPAGSVQCHVGLQRIALGNLVIEVDRHAVPP